MDLGEVPTIDAEALETAGTVAATDLAASVGTWLVLAGSVLYAFLVLSLFAERRFR